VLKTSAEGEQGGDIDLDEVTGTFTIEVLQRNPLQNDLEAFDVNNDLDIAPEDALFVINYLNAWGSQDVLPGTLPTEPFVDANGNNNISPEDALEIINYLNSFNPPPEPEPEEKAAGDRKHETVASQLPVVSGPLSDDLLILLASDTAAQPRRRV
jgi:hypothetical protein